MKLLVHSCDTPQENLALEEYIFDTFEDEVLRIWVNPKSVIVGKHQNALSEANLPYCLENNIPVIRRISGGGTVYHDEGNINFSFFRKVQKHKMIDYDRNLEIIQSTLNDLGYPVESSKRHDLFLGDKKISGNAQHMKQGKALHHGTILYDADPMHLRGGIKREDDAFKDKAVKSVRSSVMNLSEHKRFETTGAFLNSLVHSLKVKNGLDIYDPAINQEKINELIKEKYSQDEWNFGYSPAYKFHRVGANFEVKLNVSRGGSIHEAYCEFKGKRDEEVERALVGTKHFSEHVKQSLRTIETIKEFNLIEVFF